MAEAVTKSREERMREVAFVPCTTKESLHDWIQVFLGLDIPDCIVDEESNCTPMDMIWEVYSKSLANNDPEFNRVLYYAARDCFKTISASVLEVLSVVHLRRSVAHMAAIEDQAQKAQKYDKKFFTRPILKDFLEGDNAREIIFVRYQLKGDPRVNLTRKQWNSLPDSEKDRYECCDNYIKIIICTIQGANSEHCPTMCVDEVDVVKDIRAYEEAKMIPAPFAGAMPITFLTSSRKFAYGLVQEEIDKQEATGLKVRHWNLMDCTEACSPERHKPELPRLPLYRSIESLTAVDEATYKLFDPDKQKEYAKEEAYQGCASCRLYPMCHGRLATKQKSTSPLLKPIQHSINQFRTVTLPTAKAQLLCWKPSTEGLIYPNFDRGFHMISAAKMAEMITGDRYPANLTKGQLLQIMQQHGVKWRSGMDFGYGHNFCVVTGGIFGNKDFIVDVITEPELLPDQQINKCVGLKALNGGQGPTIYPDPENPQLVKLFKKHGFRMKQWKKGPGSVNGGIDIVRVKLKPVIGEPQLFFLEGDVGCEFLAKKLASYHYKTDAAGRISDEPDDNGDDECDALRYQVMNEFAPRGKLAAAKEDVIVQQILSNALGIVTPVYTPENWMRKVIEEQTGFTLPQAGGEKGKKGGIHWAF